MILWERRGRTLTQQLRIKKAFLAHEMSYLGLAQMVE